jgi:hypothetical protein
MIKFKNEDMQFSNSYKMIINPIKQLNQRILHLLLNKNTQAFLYKGKRYAGDQWLIQMKVHKYKF